MKARNARNARNTRTRGTWDIHVCNEICFFGNKKDSMSKHISMGTRMAKKFQLHRTLRRGVKGP